MLSQPFSSSKREMHSRALSAEFVVIGGGFAGVCAAVTAARSGPVDTRRHVTHGQ